MVNKLKLFIIKYKNKIRRYFTSNISKKAFIARRVQFFGLDNIEIGDHCAIGENTTFTVNDRSTREVSLRIGANTYIGRNNFFSVGRGVEIGEYCMFGNNCSFVCGDHVFDSPLVPYLMSGTTLEKRIYIGVNCWLGINVTVVGNVKIGHGSIIGANTMVTKDLPPFCIFVGNPGRIIKRFDFEKKLWIKGEEVESNQYFDEKIYLAYLRSNYGSLLISYYSASSQFGDI